MKLSDILEHELGDPTPKVFWHIAKMDQTELPFTKGFNELRDVKRAEQIKDPAAGKVLKKSNTMKKGELCNKKKRKKKK